MRQIDPTDNSITNESFGFKNQTDYEALGEAITKHVYKLLTKDLFLHKIYVPSSSSSSPKTLSSFVFATKHNFAKTKKLLLMIHGSGEVRAGQWSRSLIINQSIEHGTQIPYIKHANSLGYDVLVTNTNLNYCLENGKHTELEGNKSPKEHICTVWKELIEPVYDTIESFAIIAHSYGGIVALEMANPKTNTNASFEKCFGVALIDSDSAHITTTMESVNIKMGAWFTKVITTIQTRSSFYICSKRNLNQTFLFTYSMHAIL